MNCLRTAALLMAVCFVAGASAQRTLGEALGSDKQIFQQAVAAANLTADFLMSEPMENMTVFIPTDTAFANALAALNVTANELLGDVNIVRAVLGYHVSDELFLDIDAIKNSSSIATAINQTLKVSVNGSSVQLIAFGSNATIVDSGRFITNSTTGRPVLAFYSIDAVLIPDMTSDVANTTNSTKNSTGSITPSKTPATATTNLSPSPAATTAARSSAATAGFSLAAVAAVLLAAVL